MPTANQVTDDIDVVNVVSRRKLGCEIELDALAVDLDGSEYNPSSFPGIVYRNLDPKATILIFRSGELVCTGANSVEDSKTVVQHVVEKLDEIGVPVNTGNQTNIQNLVYSGILDEDGLNLNAIAIGLGLENVEYEPEQFPGLIYRPANGNQTALLFSSGKLVLAGITEQEKSHEIYQIVYDEISELGLL